MRSLVLIRKYASQYFGRGKSQSSPKAPISIHLQNPSVKKSFVRIQLEAGEANINTSQISGQPSKVLE